MERRQSLGRAALAAVLLSLVLVVAAAAPGPAGGKAAKPQAVKSKSDAARAKLDQKLQNLVATGLDEARLRLCDSQSPMPRRMRPRS